VTLAAKRLASRAFACARTTDGGLNVGTIDLAALRSNRLRSRDRPLAHVGALVRENAERRGWLILHTHDVSEDPSPYGCTPADLDAALGCVLEAGSTVLPVREALGALRSEAATYAS
jgi:hypothetical protein